MAKTSQYRTKLKQDMQQWPKSWAGVKSDIPVGKEIIKPMQSFVLAMVEEGLAYTTINRHMGNLFLLGGEIIRGLYLDDELRTLPASELILKFVEEEGGPLCRHITTEAEQKSFDATCKKLYRCLVKKPG